MNREELWRDKRNAATVVREIHAETLAKGVAMTDEQEGRYNAAADRISEIEKIMEKQDAHEALERRLDEPQRKRSIADPEETGDESRTGIRSPEYARAHNRYLRYGERGLRAGEREVLQAGLDASLAENRTLSALVGSAGGYLVTPTFMNRITETQLAFGGALQAGPTILTTDGGEDMNWPTNDDTSNTGELLGEGATVGTGDISFGFKKLSAYIYSSKMVKVPIMLLNDSSFDIEGFLSRKFGERLGRIHNTHLTTGTGASQPQGMVTGATSGVTTAGAAAILTTELIDLEHSVDPAYRNPSTCKFMWHDNTLKLVRKLQDGLGRPLWEPSLKDGVPSTLNGYQYVVNNDMPAATATNKAVLFGDFNAYYIVRIVSGVLVVRMVEAYMPQLQHGFFAVDRMDGGVQDASAVKALTMHA